MNSAAEKRVIEQWNKMSVSQKQQYFEMKSNDEQKQLVKFLGSDKKQSISLPTSNGENLVLKKINIPFMGGEDFGHVVAESQSTGKQIMVIHKATGVVSPFSQINLGSTIPDHVIGLTPQETEERLMRTHPFLELHHTTSRANITRDNFIRACKKTGDAIPVLKNYWRESICEDYEIAEQFIIHHYKNAVTQCNAMGLLYDSTRRFFNVGMKYLYEIDVNTASVMATWKNIPVLKKILINEEPRISYSEKPINPSIVLAQLICRLVAIRYDCEYTPNVLMSLATSERFGQIGSQACKVESQLSALNSAQPQAHAEVIDTGDHLKGNMYSFKICKCNLQNNRPSIFIMLELEEMKDVIDTARNQVGNYLFNQLFEPFRSYFRDMINLHLCNVPGLNASVQLIHLDHVMNIVTYVNQNSKEAQPVIAVVPSEGTEQEKEMDIICQSYKTHEPITLVFSKILPDGHFDDETKVKEFHQRIPKTLAIDFVTIEEDEPDNGELPNEQQQ